MSSRDSAIAELIRETAIQEEIASSYGVRAPSDAVQSLAYFLTALDEGHSVSSAATIRRYRHKVLSYLAWHSRFSAGSPLWASPEDAENYAHALRYPPAEWLACRSETYRNDKGPFRTPLTDLTVQQYVSVVKRFLEYATGYGSAGFSRLVRNTGRIDRSYSPVGYLDDKMWNALWRVVVRDEQAAIATGDQDMKRQGARTRWILEATYLGALHAKEIASATTLQVRRREDDAIYQYSLVLPERGRRRDDFTEVPLAPEFADGLQQYYRIMDLSDRPLFGPPATPLILDLVGHQPITERHITGVIGRSFSQSRELLVLEGAHDAAQRMQAASPRWLRNTRIVHLLDAYAEDPDMYPVIERLARSSLRRFHETLDMSARDMHGF